MAAIDLPNLAGLDEAEVAAERGRLDAGKPWCVTEIAGLQFYDYGTTGLDGQAVIPREGDRLVLVRAPENRHDGNAVEVWWRNSIRLGHLPRRVAAIVAGPLDQGVPLRAYVAKGGTGEAWSAEALLVGEPVRPLHEKRIEHAIREGIREHERRERDIESRRNAVGWVNGKRFHEEQEARRESRLVQAVNVLLPPEPISFEMPSLGVHELFAIEHALGVSRSTARRIAERAGAKVRVEVRGWYATGSYVHVTPELQAEIAAWAAKPRRYVRREHVTLSKGSHVAPAPRPSHPDDIPF